MKIGDLVSVIDDDLKGKISAFKGNSVQIEDEHGFHYEIEKHKIVPQNHNIYEDISVISKKESSIIISKKNQNKPQSIDLHFENLVKKTTRIRTLGKIIDSTRKTHRKTRILPK